MSVQLPGLHLAVALCSESHAHFLEPFAATTSDGAPGDDGADDGGPVTIEVTYRVPHGSRLAFYAGMQPDEAEAIEWPYIVKLQHHDGSEREPMPQHWPQNWDDVHQHWWATASRGQAFVAAEKTSTFTITHPDDTGKWKAAPSYIVNFKHEVAEPAQCCNRAPVEILLTKIHVPAPRERSVDGEAGRHKRLKMDPESQQAGASASHDAARPQQDTSPVAGAPGGGGDDSDDGEADRPLREQLQQIKSEYLNQQLESFGMQRKSQREDDEAASRRIVELVKGERAKVLKRLTTAESSLDEIPRDAAARLDEEQQRFNEDMDKYRRSIRTIEAKMQRREAEFEEWKTKDAAQTATELSRAKIQRDGYAEEVRQLKKVVDMAEEKLGKKRGPQPNDVVLELESDGEAE